MPPIRRVLVLAVDGAESLDVLGPVEVFEYAGRQAPGAYRIDVVGPGADGWITMGNGLRLGVEPLPDPPPRHDTHVVGLHGRVPARGRGPPGRPPRDDALGVLRRPGRALPRAAHRPGPGVRP